MVLKMNITRTYFKQLIANIRNLSVYMLFEHILERKFVSST